jgi:hypothetical protein
MYKRHGHNSKSYVSPTYRSWQTMKTRCNNADAPDYSRYGGRGITYDPKWEDFPAFLEDMGERPEGRTLERENNNGPYCKSNCKWATPTEQANNRRNSKFIEWHGEVLTLKQWSVKLGIKYNCLFERLKRGWTIEEAFTTPTLCRGGLSL